VAFSPFVWMGGALNRCPTSAISFFVFQARTR